MVDEQLIEAVREYNLLYDPQNRYYHDNIRKENAWVEISSRIGCSVSDCKKRWASLRDCFRKALKNRKTKSGQAKIKIKKWKFEEVMSFLVPFFAEREQKSNIEGNSQVADNEKSDEEPLADISMERDETASSSELYSSSTTPESEPATSRAPDSIPSIAIPANQRSETIPRPCKQSQSNSMAQVLQQYFENKQATRNKKQPDHLQKYFEAIQETVRTFTPQLQIDIKSKISQLVTEYEYRNLMSTQNNNSTDVNDDCYTYTNLS